MTYEIIVKGRLTDRLGPAFEGLGLDAREGQTVLTGEFADQAQLHGVLDRIRDFGIELVSINPIE